MSVNSLEYKSVSKSVFWANWLCENRFCTKASVCASVWWTHRVMNSPLTYSDFVPFLRWGFRCIGPSFSDCMYTWLTSIYAQSWAALCGWNPPPHERKNVFSVPVPEGISTCCCIVNEHNYPSWAMPWKEGMDWYSSRLMPSLWLVLSQCLHSKPVSSISVQLGVGGEMGLRAPVLLWNPAILLIKNITTGIKTC